MEENTDFNNMLSSLNESLSIVESMAKKSSTKKFDPNNDEFADFKEIEDENGNILLVKYGKEYEFRGNNYCIYTLCNEKTGSKQEGIAQIKNGSYVHIQDNERIEKISAFIQSKIQQDDKDNNYIYKKGDEEYLYIDVKQKEYYAGIDTSAGEENSVPIYVMAKYHIFQNIKTKEYNIARAYDYKIAYDGDYDHVVEWVDEDEVNELLIYFRIIDEVKVEGNSKYWWLILPLIIIFLYPVTELIMWILAHIFPMFWSDKFSTANITDFAVKYLPYAYHPTVKWFSHFSTNIVYLLVPVIISKVDVKDSKLAVIYSETLALVMIVALFIPNMFNLICTISMWIVIVGIIVSFLNG